MKDQLKNCSIHRTVRALTVLYPGPLNYDYGPWESSDSWPYRFALFLVSLLLPLACSWFCSLGSVTTHKLAEFPILTPECSHLTGYLDLGTSPHFAIKIPQDLVVGNKLAPLLIKEYTSIVGVKRDLKDLRDQVEEINGWLQTRYEAVWNDRTLNWLKRLKDVAYAVDNVVDEFQLKVEKHAAAAADGGIISKYMCTKPKPFILQCKVASKIKKIKRRFAKIVKQRTDYNAIRNSIPVDPPVRKTNMRTGGTSSWPDVDVSSVVGRDEDKKHIISKLQETDHQLKIKIISVIGLGGSGKTTLAKLVFNDGNINKHFDLTLWVHVSQEFDVDNLVKKMFEAFADHNPGQHGMPYIRKTISDKLDGKRFLLVLDDVWTESQFQWEEFREFLINIGAPGSRILLTTRSSKVAETVGSTDQFLLPLLSEASSWKLFIESCGMAANDMASEFRNVGKEIVDKCGGVPLAIKVIAGVLHGKDQIDQWKATRDSNLLYVEGEEQRVAACLRLSYFRLPFNLKQCFTICSVFPKGHRIDKEQLIDLWIAHDMITPEDGFDYLNVEYVVHNHFNSLVQMSFLQNVEEEDGRVACGMHDLVHDLALSILGDEISFDMPKEATSSTTKSYRYFSLIKRPEHMVPKNIFRKARVVYMRKYEDYIYDMALKHAKHLRSVTVGYLNAEGANTISQVKYLKYLAVSGLSCETLPETVSNVWSLQALHVRYNYSLRELPQSIVALLTVLPNSIGRNEKLRVLRLSFTKIERLPSIITTLRNLEWLDLQGCFELVELPEGIGNLEKLQVLNLKDCMKLGGMPVGIGQLSRLQKLGEANTELEQAVLDGLEPPPGIKELEISEYTGRQYARWMQNQVGGRVQGPAPFPFLKVMRLFDLPNLKNLHGLVELPCLEELNLQDMPSLESISGGPFPLLVKLEMFELPRLGEVLMVAERTMLDGEDGGCCCNFTPQLGQVIQVGNCLTKLQIYDCPKLEVKPHLPLSLQQMRLWGSELLLQSQGQCQGSSSPPSFSHLKELQLSDMTGLGSGHGWELLQHMTALESLEISAFPGVETELPESLWSLTSLRSLKVDECSNIYILPELLGELRSLQELTIEDCDSLTSLPQSMGQLTSLQLLEINHCDALQQLPDCLGELCSLRKLKITNLPGLTCLPQSMCCLTTSLQEIKIHVCPGITSLPQGIEGLASLEKLSIVHCTGFTSLSQGIKGLVSLEDLSVAYCPGIKSLPEGIKGLTALKRSTALGSP
ncbi:unnamed protein product [Miscanthus lutarioriparius]|uniref:Uncharacterized protein n=1 Tax=Miscanthus lutarioriparius TaxID=422564 RepID=A0A811Q7B4_9POAL|nr:unnamed protein product [Miscanthus lutarioriparius]